jgi:isopentenyl-diphosphate delta-isomerase
MIEMSGIRERKADHIEICLNEKVTPEHNHWDDIRLVHEPLPEVDLEDVDTSVTIFGRKLSFPLIVTAITGGYPKAERINSNLAEACSRVGIGMGVGSQRAALEGIEVDSYTVMAEHDIPLRIGNIGAPQLIQQREKDAFTADKVAKAFEMISADIMAVHMNFLQEVAQPEGDTRAYGCLEAIRALAREFPLLAKETGAGVDERTARKLMGAGVKGIDVSGMSGTSFSAVEMYRAMSKGDRILERVGRTFFDWGIPSPVTAVWANVGIPVIASGGIRNGLDIARGISLGASCAGAAAALLGDALTSADAVEESLLTMKEEFRAAMFLTGCKDVSELAKREAVVLGATREWLSR